MREILKNKNGITLISLLITIIVLLILAGVSIATLTGDNGILTQVENAKNATEIAEEKEIIGLSAIQATNNSGNLDETNLQQALNENSKEGNKASIIESDIDTFFVKFESERYYEVNKNGNIEYIENITGEKTLTVQCVNSKDEVLAEYKYTILKDNYSKVSPVVEGYEAKDEKIEGEITEDTIIKLEYYLILQDDTTLVFTGLDASGNITTNESEIVSYMVGDGSSTDGNGLKEKSPKSVLRIPEVYQNKPTTKIGSYAFYGVGNITKATIGDNVTSLGFRAFCGCSLKSLVLGKNVTGTSDTFIGSGLKSVTIKGSNVTAYFFYGCDLTEINIEGNKDIYNVENNVLYSADWKRLIIFPNGIEGEFILPDTVEKISDFAFSNSKLTSIVISENVKVIENRAFTWSSISTVIIDSTTIAVKLNQVDSCGWIIRNNVQTVYIKNNITEIGSYITENYTETASDKEGYVKYVKNT